VVDLLVGFDLGFGCVLRRLAGLVLASDSPMSVSVFGSVTATSSAESATLRP
jgi:hypothetical protein